MSTGTGLSGQFGLKKETTFGTAVTVDKFFDIISAEIETETDQLGELFIGQRSLTTGAARTIKKGASGDIVYPVMTKGMDSLFEMLFGSRSVVQVGATAEWVYTYVPDTAGHRGLSATGQVGLPATSGTVHPFTYAGGKVIGWSFEVEANGPVTLTVTWAFADADLTKPLASPSYVTGRLQFYAGETTLTWGGVDTCVKKITIASEREVDLERYCTSSTIRKEPLLTGEESFTVETDAEFAATALYSDYVSGTQKALVVEILGPEIPTTTNPYKLLFTFAAAKLTDAAEPSLDGPEVLEQSPAWKALANGTDPVAQLDYHTDDAVV